ncbi:MAG: 2Fe-2S iron-sulfur cluster binding domain-containing protein [Hyphomicrobiaceae bacterium]
MTAGSQDAFEIYLAWSEQTLIVPHGISALTVLREAGIEVEPGCETGGCGTCAMTFVEGDLIHKDTCLSAAERAHHFCPCVSRARTRIVLAL